MTTQDVLANFILNTERSDIDPVALERGRAAIIDCVGVTIAGSITPIAKLVKSYLQSGGDLGDGFSSILLGNSERASAPNAAFFNGVAAHALDFDDSSHPGNAHFSCSIVPALMSVTSDKELFNEDFLTAYSIGYEVDGKIGRSIQRHKRNVAWHPTGTIGPIGCAAAIAKLLNFDYPTTVNALGIAASCGAGLRANVGSMTKSYHSGRAAQAGVTAALLAREGYDSSADAFDGRTGYFRGFGLAEPDELARDVQDSLALLGREWEISTDIGIQIKPWPSCTCTHPPIEAALRIGSKIDVKSIKSINLGTCSVAPDVLVYHLPDEGLQGKFSMEYCVAAALRDGKVTMDSFTDEAVRDVEIRELIGKMHATVDDRVADSSEHGVVVEVILNSGERFEEIIELAKGKGGRWMAVDEQLAKFEGTAGQIIGVDNARSLFSVMSGENSNDAAEVVQYLTGEAKA